MDFSPKHLTDRFLLRREEKSETNNKLPNQVTTKLVKFIYLHKSFVVSKNLQLNLSLIPNIKTNMTINQHNCKISKKLSKKVNEIFLMSRLPTDMTPATSFLKASFFFFSVGDLTFGFLQMYRFRKRSISLPFASGRSRNTVSTDSNLGLYSRIANKHQNTKIVNKFII